MSASEKPTGPLAGVRVIEWGNNYTVPLAAMGLADQGADVIKVESPAGDGTRHTTAHRKGVKGMAASFVTANRNKRSIILDMKQPGAVDTFKALVKNADVVMQNFRPGVVDAYGLGYEGLQKIKPDIIFVSVSGYGTQGPYSKQRAWDPVVQAVAGMMSSQSDPETNEPGQIRTSIVDKVTSLTVFQAVTAALYAHAKTGKGQHIEIDMLSAALAFSWTDAMFNHVWQGDGVQLGFDVRNLRLIYPTKDGRHICTIAISDPEWVALATAVGRTNLITDARFKTSFDRLKRSKEIFDELRTTFVTKTAGEWLDILRAADTVCAPVNREDTLHSDPQIQALGLVHESEHPQAGRYRQIVPPVNFGGTPSQIRRHAPMLGEHADEILREAGLDAAQIADLRKSGAVG
jgi:crotonobetainyl-CoA:carnitine CoA-transferase CaiB-like acyl-CoA transferase